MPNVLLTISMVTREALRVLENNLTFTKQVNRQYDDKFGVEGAKIGTTLNVRKPPRYIGRTGQTLTVEDAVETQVLVTLNTQFGVDLSFSSQDLALSIDDFSDRFIKPAVATVANKIDADGLALAAQIANTVGVPGTVPNTLLTYLLAGVKLDENAAPMDGLRSIVITPMMQATIVDALKGLFQQSNAIAEQYMRGQMGRAIGFDWFMDQNCATIVGSTFSGVPAVTTAAQSGATINTNGWTTTALKKGTVFTIAGVGAVNPQTRAATGSPQQFTVTADIADTAGAIALPISPAIVGPGTSAQNVTALPGAGALLTMLGATGVASPTGLAFHRDAFTLVCADLPLPGGVDMAARISDKQLGMSIRMIRAYDINTDRFPCRLDILYGWAVLRQELACRIQS